MTDPKDIIGIVKELQDGLSVTPIMGRIGATVDIVKVKFVCEALLIAVEALEDIQKVHLEASTRPGGYVSVSSQVMCNKTFEALSRIRSL